MKPSVVHLRFANHGVVLPSRVLLCTHFVLSGVRNGTRYQNAYSLEEYLVDHTSNTPWSLRTTQCCISFRVTTIDFTQQHPWI
ncbi:hypothetical protein AA0116_g12295 [Alternaria tenuissima]|nr:hypothetical protein AA0116_g12295 [Alternaria tenuissima]